MEAQCFPVSADCKYLLQRLFIVAHPANATCVRRLQLLPSSESSLDFCFIACNGCFQLFVPQQQLQAAMWQRKHLQVRRMTCVIQAAKQALSPALGLSDAIVCVPPRHKQQQQIQCRRPLRQPVRALFGGGDKEVRPCMRERPACGPYPPPPPPPLLPPGGACEIFLAVLQVSCCFYQVVSARRIGRRQPLRQHGRHDGQHQEGAGGGSGGRCASGTARLSPLLAWLKVAESPINSVRARPSFVLRLCGRTGLTSLCMCRSNR